MSDWDGVWIKCSILNGQVIYIETLKLNIADMWLIPLDHVTYIREQIKRLMESLNCNWCYFSAFSPPSLHTPNIKIYKQTKKKWNQVFILLTKLGSSGLFPNASVPSQVVNFISSVFMTLLLMSPQKADPNAGQGIFWQNYTDAVLLN